uniref:Photosystem II reaction center protein Z n=1 Tax=Pseudochlorodesmis sp. HV01306c TaxID=2358490 RepID=A0A386AYI7_9CHLO|nr:photosystem II protein Z [Pseudochlorodesmis sp. HV01306c]
MNLLFQLAVFSFILFSFLLVIGVPVVFAYGDSSTLGWTKNKTTLFTGVGVWFLLVFAVGILNSFVV